MKKSLLLILILLLSGCAGAAITSTASPPANRATATVQDEAAALATAAPVETVAVAKSEEEPLAGTGEPSPESELDHAGMLNQLLFASPAADPEAVLAGIRESGDTRFIAGLIDTLRYQRGLALEIGATLNALTGQDLSPDWFDWVEWAGKHPEFESFEAYPGWKANLFAQIDPNFLRFVHQGMRVAPGSRVEEIVWGGVRVDGIPALDNPKMVDPAQADYLVPEERVFGVSLNGDTRAYPARFLDWHEMFNDVIGGEPVSLAY